jgi:hypothetical protein
MYHTYMVVVCSGCVLDCVACLVGHRVLGFVLKLYEYCVKNQVFGNGVKSKVCLLRSV